MLKDYLDRPGLAEIQFRMDRLWRQKKWLRTQKWAVMVAAVVVSTVVAAAVYLIPPQPVPTIPTARVHGPVFQIATRRTTSPLAIPKGQYTGVEAIYLMKSGQYDPNRNLEDNSALWAAKISESGQVVEVRAMQVSENGQILNNGQVFDIVVTVRAKGRENVSGEGNFTYLRKDTMMVELSASGAFTIPPENAPDEREYIFENQGYGTADGYMRVNVVWDNDGEGYLLMENAELVIDRLWLWLELIW